MKRILLSVLSAMMIMFSASCAKCISVETHIVQVKIVDEYHRSYWTQTVIAGNSSSVIIHPAAYTITVEYDGREYNIEGADTYNKYKHQVGQYVKGVLTVKKYDDGSDKAKITRLE